MTNNTMPTDNIPRRLSAVNGLRFVPEAEAEILHRYNVHDRLVEALEKHSEHLSNTHDESHEEGLVWCDCEVARLWREGRAALSLAKGGRE